MSNLLVRREKLPQVQDIGWNRWFLLLAVIYCVAYGLALFGKTLPARDIADVNFRLVTFTAAGFFLSGISLLMRYFRKFPLSVAGGMALELLAVVQLALVALNLPGTPASRITGKSELTWIGVPLCFLLAGIAIQFLGYGRNFRLRSAFVAMCGSMLMGFGLISLANSLAGLDNRGTQSAGLAIVGAYLLITAWNDPIRSERPLWFNVAVALGSLTANTILWQGLIQSAESPGDQHAVASAVFYAGLLGVICLTAATHFAQTAHARAKAMELLNFDILEAYDATLQGWANALELRDNETKDHTTRVTDLSVSLARMFNVSEIELLQIRRGAMLHDIGKIGIPDSILLKSGPLTDDEWGLMKMHPVYAYEFLNRVAYLRPALDIPLYHHEKWDGSGYPAGLAGTNIPFAARLFAVIDVWDALTSDRPYRAAMPDQEVADYIKAHSGSHFDPEVVKVFLQLVGYPASRQISAIST